MEDILKKMNIEHRTSNIEHRMEKMEKQTYDLEERLLEYSVRIIKIVEQLPNTRAGNHVAGHLLKRLKRSGNSYSRFGIGYLKTNEIK